MTTNEVIATAINELCDADRAKVNENDRTLRRDIDIEQVHFIADVELDTLLAL